MFFFMSSRRRHTRWNCDWSSDVCSSDLAQRARVAAQPQLELVRGPDEGGIGARRAGRAAVGPVVAGLVRSEERRVGKECRSRSLAPYIATTPDGSLTQRTRCHI